jgi:outer membrane protein assembly factor BamB
VTSPSRKPHHWRPFLGALAFFAIAAAAALAFYVHKRLRPGDVFHPHVTYQPNARPDAPIGPKTTTWPLYGFSKDHNRYYDASPSLRPPFRLVWTVPGNALLEFPPVIANGVLFQLTDAGALHAVAAQSGKLLWHIRLGSLAASAPAASGLSVYVTLMRADGSAGRVLALLQQNGRVRWSRDLPSPSESSPLLDRGKLYLGSQDGTVYALNAHNGRIVWTYHAQGAVKASPTLRDDNLYFGDYGGFMQAVDERTGRRVWVTGGKGLLGGGNFYSTPAAAFGRIFAGNTDGRVYAFAARSGRLAWAKQTGSYVYSSPAVEYTPGLGPTVYVGSYDGHLYALSAYSGGVRWVYNAGGRISGSPTIIGQIVYFADLGTHTTIGLDARTGRLVYRRGTGSFDPAVTDGSRLFLSGYSGLSGLVPMPASQASKSASSSGQSVRGGAGPGGALRALDQSVCANPLAVTPTRPAPSC